VFGEVADQYDRARPGYPPSLVDQIVGYAALVAGDPALEVGCGTGKATVSIAQRGVHVQAVEPDPAMAEVASRNCRDLAVTVDVASFEDWRVTTGAYRLVYAAQSWHWVKPEVRLAKAHAALGPGGALAVFWNRPDWPDTPLRHAIDAVYEAAAPGLAARTPGRSPQDLGRRAAREQLDGSPLFTDRADGGHEWDETYTTEEYIELLGTQSDHRLLDPDARARLYEGIARAVDDAGGVMPVSYSADVLLGRRAG
jgi:trans-aconitate methyltransferase